MTDSRTSSLALGPLAAFAPSSIILSRLADRLQRGRLTLVLPDGSTRSVHGAEPSPLVAVMQIRRLRVMRRLVTGGTTGFAEAYMDGDWTTPDLASLLALCAANEPALGGLVRASRWARLRDRVFHATRANTRRGSRRNIAYHYDLGNAFYERWLDPGMTYSAAMFPEAGLTLEQAQLVKYRRLADQLDLRPGHRVLEIGCGWGGFAEVAAREYGCHVTAVTLSREQFAYARRRMAAAGLDHQVDVVFRDYRQIEGTFDRIASIEMFEAVGEPYWSTFFDVVRARLTPGGRAGLQIITIDDDRFERYRKGADFIQRYIFPGGMLPSPSALTRAITGSGLRLAGSETFGHAYAETLARWGRRFQRAWPQIRPLGFDARFKRMWEFYLAYCEAGFRSGPLDVGQYLVVRD
jgi:cyclopropane-fatty-acyl-phospholipid synthase